MKNQPVCHEKISGFSERFGTGGFYEMIPFSIDDPTVSV